LSDPFDPNCPILYGSKEAIQHLQVFLKKNWKTDKLINNLKDNNKLNKFCLHCWFFPHFHNQLEHYPILPKTNCKKYLD
jgi:hypothetical protein